MTRRDNWAERLADIPLFRACNKKELAAVARVTESMRVPKGTRVVREGEAGSEFYVVMSGRAKVHRRGRDVDEVGPGDYFGELALLDTAHRRRDATVTAVGDLELLCIGSREFSALLDQVPTLNRKLLAGMARRLHELDGKA